MSKTKSLEELRLAANRATAALREAEEEDRDKVQRPILRTFVGRCFKYSNSYGAGYPRWFLYAKIVKFSEADMTYTTLQFQHTSMDHIEIKHEQTYNFRGENRFGPDSSWQPITKAEYSRELKKLKALIEKLTA